MTDQIDEFDESLSEVSDQLLNSSIYHSRPLHAEVTDQLHGAIELYTTL